MIFPASSNYKSRISVIIIIIINQEKLKDIYNNNHNQLELTCDKDTLQNDNYYNNI